MTEPHGAGLLAAAIARYGPGTVTAIEPEAAPPGGSGLAPEGVLGATLGAAALVLVLAALVGRRSLRSEPPAR